MTQRDDLPDALKAKAYLSGAVDLLADRCVRAVSEWVVDSVEALLDTWGEKDDAVRSRARAEASRAGGAAAEEAHRRLGDLAASDMTSPGRAGPLEALRTLYVFPTEVLRRFGVGEVERDLFEARHFPDDVYGLRIQSFRDLPDGDALAELHVVWGVAKAAVLRETRGSLFE